MSLKNMGENEKYVFMYVRMYIQYLLIYFSSYLRIEDNNAVRNNVSSVRSKNFYLLGDTICRSG